MHPLTRVEPADDVDLRHSLQYGQLPSAYVDDDPRAFLSAYSSRARSLEDYVTILEDLLVAVRLPSFQKRAKRRVATHPKFFFFDTGVCRAIRPRGPLDSPEEIDGPAFETLLMQELRAHVAYRDLGYELFYWRTSVGVEVDLVLYGERGRHAFEVKRASRLRQADLAGLRAFRADYPTARCTLAYSGTKRYTEGAIEIVPLDQLLAELPARL